MTNFQWPSNTNINEKEYLNHLYYYTSHTTLDKSNTMIKKCPRKYEELDMHGQISFYK